MNNDSPYLAKNTLCLCDDGKYRYATGSTRNGYCEFYHPGYCSKNDNGDRKYYTTNVFEIIEEPEDLERMVTPDDICIEFGCKTFANKRTEVGINNICESCKISVSTPTNFEAK